MTPAVNPNLLTDTIDRQHPFVCQTETDKTTPYCNYHTDELLASMDQGYCIIDILFDSDNKPFDYRFLEVNPAFEKQTNLKNIKGKSIKELLPNHEQYWFDIYGEVALSGKALRFQRWASQFNRYYDVYAFRISGQPEKKVAVLFTDITDKKRSENNLSFLFDITKSLVNSPSPDETLEMVGSRMGDYLGLSYFVFAKLIKAENKIEIIYSWHPPYLPDINGDYAINDYITTDIKTLQWQGENMVVDNTTADIRLRAEKYKDSPIGSFVTIPLKRNDNWEFMVCVCRNEANIWRNDEIEVIQEATLNTWTSLEHKRIERDLFYSEERLRLAIETGKVGICDLDYEAGTSYCNEVRYAMYGMQPSSLRTPVSEFFSRTHPDDRETLRQNVYLGLETTGKFTAEFRVVHDDGTVRWISENGQVTERKNGKPHRVISTLIDITQRKTEELQKDDFFKIASHELKSPITNIKGVAYMLDEALQQEDSDGLALELNRQLQRQTERLSRLVSNMLDATRASMGHLDYDMKTVNVAALLQEVVQDLQNTTQLHKLRLSLVPLPIVNGDCARLLQVFTNLISNAIKYTPSSSRCEAKEIFIDTQQINKEIRIVVTDSGIGMSAGTKERLFERFFRSDTPDAHHYPGLGLGLYISREIMKRHGGDIYVQSEKNKGSVFTLVLPVKAS